MLRLTILRSFFIASNDPAKATREKRGLLKALVGSPGAEDDIKEFFYEKTRELMLRESCQSVGSSVHTVDIVRDVLKVVPIHWACGLVCPSGFRDGFLRAERRGHDRLESD